MHVTRLLYASVGMAASPTMRPTVLAMVTLAPFLLQGESLTASGSAAAFVGSTQRIRHASRRDHDTATSASPWIPSSSILLSCSRRPLKADVCKAVTPHRMHFHPQRVQTTMALGRGRLWTMLSKKTRRWQLRLRAAAAASSTSNEGRDGTSPHVGKRSSHRGGGAVQRDSEIDQTAPVEVQRALSTRKLVVQMLQPDFVRISLSIVWAMVATAAALSAPLAYANVVTAILDPGAPFSRLTNAIALLGVGYAVEPVATYLYVKEMSRVIDRAAATLKVKAFRSLLSQEVAFFDLAGSAELSAAVTTDVMTAKTAAKGNLQRDRGVRAVLETACGLGILFKLSPKLAWIFGLGIPVAAWGLAESRKRLGRLGAEEGKALNLEAGIATEAVRNIREVRGFGAEARELARFQAACQGTATTSAKIGAASGRLEALNRAAIYASILTVLLTGGRLVMAGSMSAPLLLSFVGFCFSLNFAMQGVNFTVDDAKRGQAALERVFQVMAPTKGKSARLGMDVIPPREFKGRVDFRKVHFTYPTRPDTPVFSGLDLTLPAGKVTALVGYSGGGKSTIAALLSRFYAPYQGDILIDGVDVTDLDRKWLTQRMALVGQNPALFTGTIAQNIAYGAASSGASAGVKDLGGVSMEKVTDAAELANAKEFIEEFPDGFDTSIGEGGVQLSGGQRQRIAIARAVLKDARILILDEATSALDAQSEALVQDALNRLMDGKTVLVIAHRLSTVVNADKICVLSQGKVIEEGTHEELLEREGAYSNLMNTQVRSFSTIAD